MWVGNVMVRADMQAVPAVRPAAGKNHRAQSEEGLGGGHGPLGPGWGCSPCAWSCGGCYSLTSCSRRLCCTLKRSNGCPVLPAAACTSARSGWESLNKPDIFRCSSSSFVDAAGKRQMHLAEAVYRSQLQL